MELTRKVRLKQGFSDLHQDGKWYRPGDELGVTEATYQALRHRFDLIDSAKHVAADVDDDMPEFPDETSVDDEDDAEEPKRRQRGRPAKKKQEG